MNWSDYEAVWKRQPPPVGASADLTILKETFATKSRQQAALLRRRDYVELSAGIFAIIFYIFYWWKVGPKGWPMAFSILLILWIIVFFIRERLRVRRDQVPFDIPLLQKISHDLAELRHQRQLLLKVWRWYIAPCAGAILVHSMVILHHAKPGSLIRDPAALANKVLFIVLIGGLVWLLNLRAVRKNIEPRIAELEKLQRDLRGAE